MTETGPFLESAWADLSPVLKGWLSESDLRSGLEEWLCGQLEWCTDHEFSARFHKACPVPGAAPEEYLQRLLETPSGARILVGIRFRGRDRSFPFVDLVASTRSLLPAEAVHEAVETIALQYTSFEPRAVRILRSCAAPALTVGPRTVTLDQSIVTGKVRTLNNLPALPTTAEVAFEPTRDIPGTVDFVRRAYEEFFSQYPSMAGTIHPADADDLRTCEQAACLGYAIIDGQRAGVISAAPRTNYGLRGHEVIEEIIAAPWRGRGFGPVVQRAMVDHLATSQPESLLFGAIASTNLASRSTALRVGRTATADYLFVALR
ncbi:MAG: hypothetical protein QGG40_09070 [Myxococcota bacterium]|nr:hypothetical protein [Myxococcota bacterium]